MTTITVVERGRAERDRDETRPRQVRRSRRFVSLRSLNDRAEGFVSLRSLNDRAEGGAES